MFFIIKMHKRFLLLTTKVVDDIIKMIRIIVIATKIFVNRYLEQF